MSNHHPLHLPKELELYREKLEQSVQPVVTIEGSCTSTTLFESKFAGHPYLPKSIEHPKGEDDVPLRLLAQINFAEVPRLDHFPEKGILQFYLAANDDLFGMDFDEPTNQTNFRILYHSDVTTDESELVTDFSYMEEPDEEYFPVGKEAKLSFTLNEEPISDGDYRFEHLSIDLEQETGDGTELWDVYAEHFAGTGAKIGGYPFFTQEDPRSYEEQYQQHNILLLQIDTDDDLDIMWGDSGVGNFFITKEDLEKLDFSNVMYNWDCC
ncbi:YwqG family protein [Bacillus sp. FJAT-42315]|uniref:YwqG family protein n=1 Tax=Bacillus sp. FJAT-42315 TaxID=2014077 RepID=UPI000C23C2DE|nr:YwqG family protein [Bacillus sp. FJAT-42315]